MPIMVTSDVPGVTRAQYDTVREDIGWDARPPAGALLHMAAFDAVGMRTVDIWETQDLFDAYLEGRFKPAVERAGLPAMTPATIDVQVVAVSPKIETYFLESLVKAPTFA